MIHHNETIALAPLLSLMGENDELILSPHQAQEYGTHLIDELPQTETQELDHG